ncbi:MAG: hypothetical protein ACO3EZ_15450, partial [Prochlorotrichaceae cyanobacterium]
LRLPPLQRRGILNDRFPHKSPPLEGCPVGGGCKRVKTILGFAEGDHPVRLRLPPLQRRGILNDRFPHQFPSFGGVPRRGGVVTDDDPKF